MRDLSPSCNRLQRPAHLPSARRLPNPSARPSGPYRQPTATHQNRPPARRCVSRAEPRPHTRPVPARIGPRPRLSVRPRQSAGLCANTAELTDSAALPSAGSAAPGTERGAAARHSGKRRQNQHPTRLWQLRRGVICARLGAGCLRRVTTNSKCQSRVGEISPWSAKSRNPTSL